MEEAEPATEQTTECFLFVIDRLEAIPESTLRAVYWVAVKELTCDPNYLEFYGLYLLIKGLLLLNCR